MASILKHTWSTSVKNDSGAAVLADPPTVIIGDREANFAVSVNPGQTVEVDADITVLKIVSGFVSSDQAVTVNTNAADGSTGQSIALAAAKAFSWNNATPGMGSNPFTPNITKFYCINAGAKIANVRGGFLIQD